MPPHKPGPVKKYMWRTGRVNENEQKGIQRVHWLDIPAQFMEMWLLPHLLFNAIKYDSEGKELHNIPLSHRCYHSDSFVFSTCRTFLRSQSAIPACTEQHGGETGSQSRLKKNTHRFYTTWSRCLWKVKYGERKEYGQRSIPGFSVDFWEVKNKENKDNFLPAPAALVILLNICKTKERKKRSVTATCLHLIVRGHHLVVDTDNWRETGERLTTSGFYRSHYIAVKTKWDTRPVLWTQERPAAFFYRAITAIMTKSIQRKESRCLCLNCLI